MRTIVPRSILLATAALAAGLLAGWPPIATLAQEPARTAADPRGGANFIATKLYSQEEDQETLKLFAGLRVSDVVDGMDKAGLQGVGQVSADIRPVWRDTVHYSHRFSGIAVTARYVPTNKPPAGHRETKDFDRWVGQWYTQLSPEPFVPLIRPGTALVIEDAASVDVGTIGSNNILGWKARGCVGVVTSAGARDTDEITTERVPLYFAKPARGIRPGRNEIESVNRPIVVGGVLVRPGDVIVADGDGVIVVPRQAAQEVAECARAILDGDKAGRRRLYEKLGLPLDDSVK
jgi:regulator of RNase E activity RraA